MWCEEHLWHVSAFNTATAVWLVINVVTDTWDFQLWFRYQQCMQGKSNREYAISFPLLGDLFSIFYLHATLLLQMILWWQWLQ
jgi:hypothetical protein